jgi:hypothetical protein
MVDKLQVMSVRRYAKPTNARRTFTRAEGASVPSRDEIAGLLLDVRGGRLKLDTVVSRCRTSKPELAKRLWPVLRHRTWLLARRTLEPVSLGDTGMELDCQINWGTAVLVRRRVTCRVKAQMSRGQAPPDSRRVTQKAGFCRRQSRDLPVRGRTAPDDLGFHLSLLRNVSHAFGLSRGYFADKA